ncbi:MAG: hypothetical protein ACXAD7_12220 [Candidatus Kariarchaeaceae archaeon]|jgi:hypothetical protein
MAKGQIFVVLLMVILGAGAIGSSIVVPSVVDDQLDSAIKDARIVPLSTETEDYEDWLTSTDEDDPPLYKRYYFWNLTNPTDFLAGETPLLEEIGPYVYRQYDTKFDVI